MATFSQASRTPWRWVNSVCPGAAVFLDGGAAELLHWAGGVALLGDCVGVYDLYHDLNPVARDFIAAAPYCHVVVVVTTFLHGRCSERLSRLLSELQPLQCHVFCSQPEGMHAELVPMPGEAAGQGDEEEGYSYYGEFQALMRKWINRESGVRVSVEHIPLFHCEVCPGLEITPAFSVLFPLCPTDVTTIQATLREEGSLDVSLEHLGQVEFSMLTHQLQTTIRSFASAVDGLLSQLDLSEELFSLGATSQLIASQLAGLPAARARRKSATRRGSLLLVDRTLDLSGPTSHPPDSLADKILSLLPRLPQHSCDVCVDMKPVSTAAAGVILPGCLAQPQSARAQSLLRTLLCSRQKEALMEVSRCLLDALSKEGLSARLTGKLGRPSATQLTGFLQQFRSHPSACVSQAAVLQLACAVVQALEGEGSKRWEEAAGREKLLALGVGDGDSDSVVRQLASLARKQLIEGGGDGGSHVIPTREGGGGHMTPAGTTSGSHVTLSELLGLAVCMYSMVGEDCVDDTSEEGELKEALADLILRHRECDAVFIQSLAIERSHSRPKILERLGAVFTQLVGLGEARDQLKQFRHIYAQQEHSPLPYNPLLAQVVDAIFHPSRPDLPDIHHHSLGLAGMLKSGFSLFMSSARPRPNNHPLLLLFVVGGVTCSEVRQIRDIVTSHKTDTQVVVGATRLLTADDITRQVLCTDQLRTC